MHTLLQIEAAILIISVNVRMIVDGFIYSYSLFCLPSSTALQLYLDSENFALIAPMQLWFEVVII